MNNPSTTLQRPHETQGFAAAFAHAFVQACALAAAAVKQAWATRPEPQPDALDSYLAESACHDDFAIRQRAFAQHEVHLRAMSRVL